MLSEIDEESEEFKMNDNKKHNQMYGWLMMLCCLVPILAFMFFAPQLKNLGGGNLSWLFLLVCPIMHIGMMFFMKDMGGSCHGNHSHTKEESKKTKAST